MIIPPRYIYGLDSTSTNTAKTPYDDKFIGKLAPMTTTVKTKEIQDKGYIIVRECVPPDQLGSLRGHCEQMVERHKQWWADNRQPHEPPGGEWESGPQPRVLFDRVVDREATDAIDFVFHQNTYGISQQLMQSEEVAPLQFGMFCNPRVDHGPWDWHRDIRSWREGPLEGLFTDFLANPPAYTQWNIALYDDGVLWVIPGSHRRFNTEAENEQLSRSEHERVGGGIPVELKAGDGVVYLNTILHWGSNYSTKLRRTLQYTYRAFGNGVYPHAHSYVWRPELVDRLPAHLATKFQHFLQLEHHEHDLIERIFRAIISKDGTTFRQRLAELHAREEGRMTCLVLLSKRARSVAHSPREPMRDRFTVAERELLWQRFIPLDGLLQTDSPQLVPGFQNKEPTPYIFNEMPDWDVDDFVISWDK